MRRLAILAVVVALISPAVAAGQDYTFGDWARDHGYEPGDEMPGVVRSGCLGGPCFPKIDSLDGISEFDWTATPTMELQLANNQISRIERGTFIGLTDLTELNLWRNPVSNIEPGAFTGLTNLTRLVLENNQLSSIEPDTFSGLTKLRSLDLRHGQISDVEPSAFSELTNLTFLRLEGNQISSIEPGTFSELTKLRSLYLGRNQLSDIESGDFSGLTNLTELHLGGNQISSIESGDFSGLTNLTWLVLENNQLSSIESGAFSGRTNLMWLWLGHNPALTELNLAEAVFSSLESFSLNGSMNISRVSLENAVVSQSALASLMDAGPVYPDSIGIGELDGITNLDLSSIDFADIIDLGPLYVMDDLIDLWLVDTQNVDATALDVLLDNLATIEGTDTEGVLHMTLLNFIDFIVAGDGLLADWHAEPGHHVEFLQIGDVNHDTEVNGLDVDPFVDVLLASRFDVAADMNGDGVVNGLDVDPFVEAVVAGGAQAVPEPSTLAICIIALAVVGGWRKWSE